MPTDGPRMETMKKGSGAGSRDPKTTHVEVKQNMLSKKTTSGGPADSGGKQGAYKQPY